jgi:hypothetical protein
MIRCTSTSSIPQANLEALRVQQRNYDSADTRRAPNDEAVCSGRQDEWVAALSPKERGQETRSVGLPDTDMNALAKTYDGLDSYALEAVFDRCGLGELARLSQVDSRSRQLAIRTFKVKWTPAMQEYELLTSVRADDLHAIHFARRQGMTIDTIRVESVSLLAMALQQRLKKETYAALLQMVDDPGRNLWAPPHFGNNPGFLLAAIKAKCPEAIKAFLDSTHYPSESGAGRLVQAINHGNVDTLRALVESGRYDVNALHLGQSPLRHEIARNDHDMDRIRYLLSLPMLDVNAGGLPAAPLGADIEKYRLYLGDPRVDVNHVITVPQRAYQSSALNVAVKLAMYFFDTRVFDLLITDPRLDVNERRVHENGRQMDVMEAIEVMGRIHADGAGRDIANYLQGRLSAHPSYIRPRRVPFRDFANQ